MYFVLWLVLKLHLIGIMSYSNKEENQAPDLSLLPALF